MNLPSLIALCAFCLSAAACIYAFFIGKKLLVVPRPHFKLTRHSHNPVISPLPIREWELNGTFNPAAVKDDEGRVHLLYRAIGADGISRIGHASSRDGLHFDERSMYPVYEPLPGSGMPASANYFGPKHYDPSFYTSGGGWGGSEDPRAVRIDGKVYMTYVAFEGWDSVRIALTSIGMDDLRNRRWRWRRPFLISPPGYVAKNWLLFPEKVNGKYAIITSIVPRVEIEYIDSLDALSSYIESKRPGGVLMGRKDYWDNRVRGAGPPPIKTDNGWLLLYHAIDKDDPDKYGIGYRIGAMLLDLSDPTKILYRSPQPILNPDMPYENDGKPGVVYATGAVIIGDNLMVYYGGGDRHVCIAQTPLKQLLDWLVEHGKV
ncbi:MAG: hypothetical protein KGI59_00745 [Patescibacteria group bacterium]|nr:hypothetical protein [Patescibacteria group bacterium]MDE2172913.1 hypothetical protein [Patescibacteria group bacterium]